MVARGEFLPRRMKLCPEKRAIHLTGNGTARVEIDWT